MKVGTICYDTHQGIAHLARDFWRHGLIDRLMIKPHPHYTRDTSRYPNEVTFSHEQADQFLDGLDLLFLFENALYWDVAKQARERGIKLVMMPMYEYSPFPPPVEMDLYCCPSLLDMDVYKDYNRVFLPVPVEKPWKQRHKAELFIHNAGHGQHDYGKGTPELLEAMQYVTKPIRLIVRGQPDDAKVPKLFHRWKHLRRVVFQLDNLPEEELFAAGDVFVYPEKWNGLSLPLQEARASGMVVMTTNRYPANTWLPNWCLLPVKEYTRYRIATEFDRAVLDPRQIAEAMDRLWCPEGGGEEHAAARQAIQEYSLQGREWAQQNSWEVLGPQYTKAFETIL